MTKVQRFKKLSKKLYRKESCTDCGGTGTLYGKKKGSMGSGCAACHVRSSVVFISPKDFKWLLEQARAGL